MLAVLLGGNGPITNALVAGAFGFCGGYALKRRWGWWRTLGLNLLVAWPVRSGINVGFLAVVSESRELVFDNIENQWTGVGNAFRGLTAGIRWVGDIPGRLGLFDAGLDWVRVGGFFEAGGRTIDFWLAAHDREVLRWQGGRSGAGRLWNAPACVLVKVLVVVVASHGGLPEEVKLVRPESATQEEVRSMGESSGTAPGRPLGFDPDAVVEELMFLFWEKGFDATTQSDMAERTGLSTSSLFNTFGDKYSIFDRALACYNSLTAEHLSPLLTGEDGVSELESLIDRRASS